MQQATDDDLVTAGKTERSRTLAKLYADMASHATCHCSGEHSEDVSKCPKAICEQAARTCRSDDRGLMLRVYVCLECGAQVAGDYVKAHSDAIHRSEEGGGPLWEHGAAECEPATAAD
jgi:hypothetical protein